MDDKAKKYYDYLKSKGVDVAPSFESFQNTLQDDTKRQKYYDYLQTKDVDLAPNFESFTNTLVVKKKGILQPQEEVSTSDSETPATPSTESGKGVEEVDFDTLPKANVPEDERLANAPEIPDLRETTDSRAEAGIEKSYAPNPVQTISNKLIRDKNEDAYNQAIQEVNLQAEERANKAAQLDIQKEELDAQANRLKDFVFKLPSNVEQGNMYEIEVDGEKQVVPASSVEEYKQRYEQVLQQQDQLNQEIQNYNKEYENLAKKEASLSVAKRNYELAQDSEVRKAVGEVVQSLPFPERLGATIMGAAKMGTQAIYGGISAANSFMEKKATAEDLRMLPVESREALLKAEKAYEEAKPQRYQEAVRYMTESAETSEQYGLATSLNDVQSPSSFLNFAVTSVGEQLPQFVQGAITLGIGTYMQELGNIQVDIVNNLMEEGATLEEAVNSEEVNAIDAKLSAFGIAAMDTAGMAFMGAGKIFKPLAKLNVIKRVTNPYAKAPITTALEVGTEIAQEGVAKGGVSSSLGKGFIEGVMSLSEDEIKNIAAKTFFNAGAFSTISAFTETGKVNQELLDEASVNPKTRQVMEGIIDVRQKAGIISPEEAQQQKQELDKSIAANLQIPEDIQGKQREELVELQKEYNDVLESQKQASPAFKELYKQDLNSIEEKMIAISDKKQQPQEIKEEAKLNESQEIKPKEDAKKIDEVREEGEQKETKEAGVGDMREVDQAETAQETQEKIKEGDTVNATVEVYVDGKKTPKRFKVEVSKVNEDGTFNLKRGKLVYKNIKPEKIAKVKPPRAKNITTETEGLTEKERTKQGVEELVVALKEKSREKLDKVTAAFKERLSKKTKDLKDFKDRKQAITSFAKDLLKGLKESGVKYIPTTKIQGILNAINQAKTDNSLNTASQKLIDTVNKIALSAEEQRYKDIKKQAEKLSKPTKFTERRASGTVKGKIDNDTRKAIKSFNTAVRSDDLNGIRKRIEEIEDSRNISDSDIAEMEGLVLAEKMLLGDPKQSEEALSQLKDLIKDGRSSLREVLKEKSERYDKLKSEAVEAVTGGEGVKRGFEASRLENKRDNILSRISRGVQGFLDLGESFRTLLDKISRDSKRDESGYGSKLDEIAYEPIARARDKRTRYDAEGEKILIDKLKEIYGKNYSKALKNNTKKKVVGDFKDIDGNDVTVTLSQAEAYPLYQYAKDPRNIDTFRNMGFTDEMIQAVEDYLTPEVKKWADWQMDEFYPKFYDKVNKVYKQNNYIDLPRQEYYVPIVRDSSGFTAQEVEMEAKNMVQPAVTYGSLKERKRNATTPFDLTNNGDRTIINYMMGMNHYRAFSGAVKDLNVIFKDPDVRSGIRQNNNNQVVRIIDEFIEEISNDGINKMKVIKSLDKLRGNAVTASLGLAPTVLIKQLSSFPAYAVDIPTTSFLKGLGKFAINPVKAHNKLMQSPYMKKRYTTGFDRDLADAMAKDYRQMLSKTSGVKDKLMFLIKWGDKGAIIMGGYSVYDYHYNKKKKSGATERQANKYALEKFEEATKLSQQSTDIEDLSSIQRGGSLAKLFTMYMTSPMAYFRQERKSLRDFARGNNRKRAVKRFMIYHFVLPMVFQYTASGLPGLLTDWGEEDEEDLIRAATLGSLNGVFLVGDLLSYVADVFQEKPWAFGGYGGSPALEMLARLSKALTDAVKEWVDNDQQFNEDVLEALIEFGFKLDTFIGFPTERINKMRKNWELILDESKDYTWQEEVALAAGYSPYIVNDKDNKKKSGGRTLKPRTIKSKNLGTRTID